MILSNYSDIGLDYDTSYVNVNKISLDGYDDVYVLASDNLPEWVAAMIIDAIDRSPKYFWDQRPDDIAEDARIWFNNPEDPESTDLGNSFWNKVGDFIYDEQESMHYIQEEYEREVNRFENANRYESEDY